MTFFCGIFAFSALIYLPVTPAPIFPKPIPKQKS